MVGCGYLEENPTFRKFRGTVLGNVAFFFFLFFFSLFPINNWLRLIFPF